MSVTNYKIPCSYLEEGLSDELYLVSASHSKVVLVDSDNHAEITNLSEAPLHIECANVEFNEETALDERYSFRKTITATIGGYANLSSLNDKYYAILKTKSGMLLMVNVDFPSDVQYTYTLADNVDRTVFTFTTLSNFPTLPLNNAFSAFNSCKQYKVSCVKSFKLVASENALYDTTNETIQLFGDALKNIDIYGNSLQFTETFNGMEVNTNITFNMPLQWYKHYWHVNLLEFQQNKYCAVIESCNDNYIYAGFNFGLIPNYVIEGDDENSHITVTLSEASLHGSYFSDVYNPEGDTARTWNYVVTVNGNSYYECTDEDGVAQYLLMAETYPSGSRTGRYKVLQGHENEFTFLNVIGTFSEVVTFPNSECHNGSGCGGVHDTEIVIGTCRRFNFGDNSWSVISVDSGLTVSPISGNAGVECEICNVSVPVGEEKGVHLMIGPCGETIIVRSTTSGTSITPKTITANCNSQTVTFAFNASCPLTVTSIPSTLTYTIGNSTINVVIPANTQTTQRTFNITVKDCRNVSETVTIVQNKLYEEWRTVSGEYVCQSGDKYTKERRYTGTTSSSLSATSETRAGTLIESGSTACSTTTYRWYDDGRFYCDGTTKYQALLEQVSYNGGETWNYTGNARYGTNLGSDSTFCDGTETYSWQLTDKFDCYEPHDYSQDYFTIKPFGPVSFKFSGSTSANTLSYSLDDGQTWTVLADDASTPIVSTNDKILWKGNCLVNGSNGIGTFIELPGEGDAYGVFNVEGNIMSLVSGDSFTEATTLTDYQFYGLFSEFGTMTRAENLILPATTLAPYCYSNMFYKCTSLWTAPQLPATSLAEGCYMNMFYFCPNLHVVPTTLPALTLADRCYERMFYYCTTLEETPSLPALTLTFRCYREMFGGCMHLTTPPELPATTLNYQCYYGMFNGCTSLNYIKCLATDISAEDCTGDWVDGVSSSGTFVKNSSMNGWSTGINGIPTGWTVVNA